VDVGKHELDNNKVTKKKASSMNSNINNSDSFGMASDQHEQRKMNKYLEIKTFSDSIHGQIKLPGLCVRILDTPEVQRLHRLKQLGVCDYVFRCANHTRLEHSLGVAHHAQVLLTTLQEQYRQAKQRQRHVDALVHRGAGAERVRRPFVPPKVTEADRLCVLVASLCHDLGHGPFSHHFEHVLSELGVHRQSPTQPYPLTHGSFSYHLLGHT
jgi:HD superfamily phosphohydrolase